jgi:hypothetical protein
MATPQPPNEGAPEGEPMTTEQLIKEVGRCLTLALAALQSCDLTECARKLNRARAFLRAANATNRWK